MSPGCMEGLSKTQRRVGSGGRQQVLLLYSVFTEELSCNVRGCFVEWLFPLSRWGVGGKQCVCLQKNKPSGFQRNIKMMGLFPRGNIGTKWNPNEMVMWLVWLQLVKLQGSVMCCCKQDVRGQNYSQSYHGCNQMLLNVGWYLTLASICR